MLVEFPYGLVLFASTMVSFVLLRKAGKAHLLMPHQSSIGAGVGITMATSAIAALGLVPYGSPHNGWHVLVVFLPQQALFATSMLLRKEIDAAQGGIALACLGSVAAGLFLRSQSAVDTDVLLCVVGAGLLALTIFPLLKTRVKFMVGIWGLVAFSPVLFNTVTPPAIPLVVLEELGLLGVKLQIFETSTSKLEDKPGWKW